MSDKTKKIVVLILTIIPSAMLVLSGIMKLMGGEQVVTGLTKAGFGSYIPFLGIGELIFVALLWYPKTSKLGFLLITGYLGGALATDLAGGNPPASGIVLAILWIAFFIKDKTTFLSE